MPNKIVDLDALLDFASDQDDVPTRQIKLFGKEWDIDCGTNAFTMLSMTSQDPEVLVPALVSYLSERVVEEQRPAWRATLLAVPNLTADKLWKIVNAVQEVVANPTPGTSPAGSPRTVSSRTSSRKSGSSGGAKGVTARR